MTVLHADPEIAVRGNGIYIDSGDTTPSPADNTDFGDVPTTDGERFLTFFIFNTGSSSLTLTGTPTVAFSGANPADFSLLQQPFSPVSSGGFTTFSIHFVPSQLGVRWADVTIANDDADEGGFTFRVQGTGIEGVGTPEITVFQRSNQDIPCGNAEPDLDLGTDFGSVEVTAGTQSRGFTIRNDGTANLLLTSSPAVLMSGPAAGDFTVTNQALSPIRPGDTGGFQIVFDPTATGVREATVTIANNDSDEPSFTFAIQGTGTLPHMIVSGNGQEIADGDVAPDLADATDFGTANVGSAPITHSFSVQNSGTASLLFGGSPRVALSGTNADDFALLLAPPASLAPAAEGQLYIRFRPSGEGLRTATVTMETSDPAAPSFSFAIQGTGVTDCPAGSISGTLWDDQNRDSVHDAGEPAVAGRTVYLDLNANGSRDVGEPETQSAADGTYQFTGLAAGAYLVAQEIPADWVQWFPNGRIVQASVASDGTSAAFDANSGEISGNGTVVVFSSYATNLVAGDANGRADIFAHDLRTGETELVSVSADGIQADKDCLWPTVSNDGRYVAFSSQASNLLSGTNSNTQVYVMDRLTRTVELASVASDGTPGNGHCEAGAISGDGRYVAFTSSASNLVADDTNEATDVFVHDRLTGTTERVSVASDGTEADHGANSPAISDDGQYVAFISYSTNLVAGDTNGTNDVFVHDRATHTTQCASVTASEAVGNGASDMESISGDGRFVAFRSEASDLVAGDTNEKGDVFLRDLQTGTTTRASLANDGSQGNGSSVRPRVSGDGRYVAFCSDAGNLVDGDTNGVHDIFVRDRVENTTERLNLRVDGSETDAYSNNYPVALSDSGSMVAFGSDSRDLVSPDDLRHDYDVFVRSQGAAALAHAVQIEAGSSVQAVDFGSHVATIALAVSSEPWPSVTVTGSHGGSTNYTANPDKGSTVTLTAPATYTYVYATYAFQHWLLDGQAQTEAETALSFTATADSTAVAVYAITEAQLSVESVPSGLNITGSPAGTTDYTQLLPTGTYVELVAPATCSEGNQDYVFGRWIVDGSAYADGKLDLGLMLTANTVWVAEYEPAPRTLSVSTNMGHAVPIEGTHPGIADYTVTAADNHLVTLTAPASYVNDTILYHFLYWEIDGLEQPDDQNTVSITIQSDTSLNAVYMVENRSYVLTVYSDWATDVPISGSKPGVTDYTALCGMGETVTLTAPWLGGNGYAFVCWEGVRGNLLTYSATLTITMSEDMGVVAVYSRLGTLYVNDAIPEEGQPGVAAGSDSYSGMSREAPMASIQALLDRYPGFAYTIDVSPGTYRENILVGPGHDGLRILGHGNGSSIIDGAGEGSCIVIDGSEVTLEGLTLCHGAADSGGGVRGINGATTTILDCAIHANTATGSGGGVALAGGCASLTNVLLTGNTAASGGGGVFADGATVALEDVQILNNTTTGDGGGILAMASSCTATGTVTVAGNEAEDHGGGILVTGGSLELDVLVCAGNQAGLAAGGMKVDGATATLGRALFVGNVATTDAGGAVFATDATVELNSATLAGNRALSGGAIFAGNSAWVTVHDSIVAENVPNQIACRDDGTANGVTILYSDVADGLAGISAGGASAVVWGDGCWAEDPLFVGETSGIWTGSVTYDEATGQSTVADAAAAWTDDEFVGCFVAPIADGGGAFPVVANTVTALTIQGDVRGLATPGGTYRINNYHVQSIAGHWTGAGWVTDPLTSICLDHADPMTSPSNEPSPHGTGANQGFYGTTEQASLTPAYCRIYVSASGPDTSVAITGTHPNPTNYYAFPLQGQGITLTAPTTVTDSALNDADFAFVRWVLDGVDQPEGERTLSWVAPSVASGTATAVYTPVQRLLTVQSLPVSGIVVTGSAGGTTDYALSRDDSAYVNFLAPIVFAAADGTDYRFSHWIHNGVDLAPGTSSVGFYIQQDETYVAVYTPVQRRIYVSSDWTVTEIEIIGNHPGTTNYYTDCDDNSTVTLTAPAKVTGYDDLIYHFVGWKVNDVLDETHTVDQTIALAVNDTTYFEPVYQTVDYTLDLQSTPLTGLVIGGTWGATNVLQSWSEGKYLTLTAPATAVDGQADYQFVRWCLDGEDQPDGERVLELRILADTTCVAVYAPLQRHFTLATLPASTATFTGTPGGNTPYAADVDDNSSVNLTAPDTITVDGTDYAFYEWLYNDGWISSDPTVSFVAYQDANLVAEYTVIHHYLLVQATPPRDVEIVGTPGGTTNYGGDVEDNTSVTLTAPATAVDGTHHYQFDHWTINGEDQNQGTLTVAFSLKSDTTCVACYVPVPRTVTVQSTPSQGLTIRDIDDTKDLGVTEYSFTTDEYSHISLLAPDSFTTADGTDYYLGCWYVNGEPYAYEPALTNLLITADTTCVAAYQVATHYFQVKSTPLTGVAITGTYEGETNCDGQLVEDNSTVTLTAPATASDRNTDYEFVRWQVDGVPQTDGERTVSTVINDDNVVFLAEYAIIQRQLTVESAPVAGVAITGTVEGNTSYTASLNDASYVTLTAPLAVTVDTIEYVFINWTLDGTDPGTGRTIQFAIEGDTRAIAHYAADGPVLTVQSSPNPGIDISGDKPGTTNYTALCNSGQTVQLEAPPRLVTETTLSTFVKWTVNGVDALGGETALELTMDDDTTVVAVYEEAPIVTFSRTLMWGWNLVSLPIEPLDCALPSVLEDGAPERNPPAVRTDSVCRWACSPEGHYEAVCEMHAQIGYWVYAEADDTVLEVRGTALTETAATLETGWNLLGPAVRAPLAMAGVQTIFGWNPLTLSYGTLAPDDDLLPGHAYWIYTTQGGELPFQE